MDTLLELGSSKAQVEPQGGLQDRPTIQAMVAASAAAVDAAWLLLYAASSDVWVACRRDQPVTDAQRARVWGSAIDAAKTSKAVVTAIYEAAGTSALYVDCPIERANRDIHAVTQHIMLAPVQLEDAGRVYFWLQPNNPLFSVPTSRRGTSWRWRPMYALYARRTPAAPPSPAVTPARAPDSHGAPG